MKKNLIIMYAIAFLQGMVFYGPIATLYRQAHGVTIFEITAIESISLALEILLEVPWGILADRIGYRKTMVSCSGLYFVSKIVFWKATGFAGFLIERVMLSVVMAGISGVDSSIIYLSCEGKNIQKAFGIYNSIGMAGLLIAAAVFSLFIKDHYSLAGLLTVISYGLAAVLSLGLTEVKHKKMVKVPSESFRGILKQTIGNRMLVLFLIAIAFLSETHQTITVFLNQLKYQQCGLDSSSIGLIYIAATILGVLSMYSAFVTKRMGIRNSLFFFSGVATISCLTLALSQYAVPSVTAILVLRIANALFQPFQMEIQNRQIRTVNRATALSINAMLMNCVAIATNLIFGALSSRSLSSAFFFGAGICMISLPLFFSWYRKSFLQR
ncbi:MAG: MFS transporter [Clostridiales bacterium]|nr:MFS transporter [Clostridiales bacterium]